MFKTFQIAIPPMYAPFDGLEIAFQQQTANGHSEERLSNEKYSIQAGNLVTFEFKTLDCTQRITTSSHHPWYGGTSQLSSVTFFPQQNQTFMTTELAITHTGLGWRRMIIDHWKTKNWFDVPHHDQFRTLPPHLTARQLSLPMRTATPYNHGRYLQAYPIVNGLKVKLGFTRSSFQD